MEADFDRYYNGRDLGATIWIDRWPASKIMARVAALPEDAATCRKINHGHTSLHELIAQVRDAVTTTAHGYRLEGAPKPYQRPGHVEPEQVDTVTLGDPRHAERIKQFFGNARP